MVAEQDSSTAEKGLRVEKMGVGVNIVAVAAMSLCAYFLAGLKEEQQATNTRLELLARKVDAALTEQAIIKSFDLHTRLTRLELSFAAHAARDSDSDRNSKGSER